MSEPARTGRWILRTGLRRWAGAAGRALPGGWAARLRDPGGSSAVEFALVAMPFLGLICVTIEAIFLLVCQLTLDIAVDRAERQMRTGEFQDGASSLDPAERLRLFMCQSGPVLFRCSDLRIEVRRGNGAASATLMPAPYDSTKGDWATDFGSHFDCPAGGDVITLRAAVPVMRPFNFLKSSDHSMVGQRELLISTTIFRTEPYVDKACS